MVAKFDDVGSAFVERTRLVVHVRIFGDWVSDFNAFLWRLFLQAGLVQHLSILLLGALLNQLLLLLSVVLSAQVVGQGSETRLTPVSEDTETTLLGHAERSGSSKPQVVIATHVASVSVRLDKDAVRVDVTHAVDALPFALFLILLVIDVEAVRRHAEVLVLILVGLTPKQTKRQQEQSAKILKSDQQTWCGK